MNLYRKSDIPEHLRAYFVPAEIGLETTPKEYVLKLVEVFREVRRVLRDDGVVWLNLGDSYNAGRNGGHPGGGKQWKPGQHKYPLRSGANVPGRKPKDLIGIPWMTAFALRRDGWYLRQDIIWQKPNPLPESVRDRCTKSHEYIFLLSKNKKYYYDIDAIREPHSAESIARVNRGHHRAGHKWEDGPGAQTIANDLSHALHAGGRNRRSVWTVSVKSYRGAHFATFPPDLIEPCILAGCPVGGRVLDPFGGSGTTAGVALKHQRRATLCEINEDYVALMPDRVSSIVGDTCKAIIRTPH